MIQKNDREITLAYSDLRGNVYDYPGMEPVFRSGRKYVRVDKDDLIELPPGSCLYMLPGRFPMFYNSKNRDFNYLTVSPQGYDINAVSSFLASGYLRTFLPGYIKDDGAPLLPMWAYCGVVIAEEKFYVPAIRIDDDPRSDPAIHQDHEELSAAVAEMKKRYPKNRLIHQLAKCSVEYSCLCAGNFFLGRYEAPVPTSPSCNAECMGCLSYQESGSGFPQSQERLNFKPTPDEIAEVILHHIINVERSVVSFGQGCEGEPLTRTDDLVKALSKVRKKTERGTININTNGSMPQMVKKLIKAGIDSIRISLNSSTEKYYNRYHRPVNYTFDDVKKSVEISIDSGIFTSVNLFFLPGFTDSESEINSLTKFLNQFPVNMIQTRNLNIDPDFYLDSIGFNDCESLGISNLLRYLHEKYPHLQFGYYNPSVEK